MSSDGDNTAALVGGVLGTVTVLMIMACPVTIVVVVLVRNRGRCHLSGMKKKYVKAQKVCKSTIMTVAVLY